MRARSRLLAGLLLVGLLPGCSLEDDPPRVDLEQVVARDLALIHAFALEAQERPGVLCVQAGLRQGGLPRLLPGSVDVFTVTEELPAPAREELVRALAEQVWDLGLSDVSQLTLSVGAAGSDDTTSSDVGRVLRGPDEGQGATAEDLEATFGPPAPEATDVPPDPGPRDC